MDFLKCIIKRMIDFSKRWGPFFLSVFAAFVVGIVPALIFLKNPTPVVILLAILASICLLATLIALYYDLKDVYMKHKKANEPSVYEKRGTLSL